MYSETFLKYSKAFLLKKHSKGPPSTRGHSMYSGMRSLEALDH